MEHAKYVILRNNGRNLRIYFIISVDFPKIRKIIIASDFCGGGEQSPFIFFQLIAL